MTRYQYGYPARITGAILCIAIGVGCGTKPPDSRVPAAGPARSQDLFVSVYCETDLIPTYLEVVSGLSANGAADGKASPVNVRLRELWSHADRLFRDKGATDGDMRAIDDIAALSAAEKSRFLHHVRTKALESCPATITGGRPGGMITAMGTLYLNHRTELSSAKASRTGE